MAKRMLPSSKLKNVLDPEEWQALPPEHQALYERQENPHVNFPDETTHSYKKKTVQQIRNEKFAQQANIDR
jgi:hypothetical protein